MGSGVEVLLGSVVVIDHLNRVPAVRAYLARARPHAVVSVGTRAETLVGYPEERHAEIVELLDEFPTLEIDADTADLAARLRRRHRWKLPEAFQAALAQRHGMRLATRNTRDFPEERFPFVLVPYRV